MRTINLCGRPHSCCPEVHISDDKQKISITDDNGGIVTMNATEFKNLQNIEV